MSKLKQPLKWHGGKYYLAADIIAMFPPHLHYVEPFAGGLSVLLAKNPEGTSEVVNDLCLDLTIFWRVLASEVHFKEFQRLIESVPFSEFEWRDAGAVPALGANELSQPAVTTAARFFVRCRQSLAGRMDSFTAITKTRTRRGMNNEVSAWLGAIEGLPAVHERLKRILVLNRPAAQVVAGQDSPGTLFYCDPPYLHSTRASAEVYEHEMAEDDHRELLTALSGIRGRFALSGYRSDLYDEFAKRHGWHRQDFTIANHAASGSAKKTMTECVWTNYDPSDKAARAVVASVPKPATPAPPRS